MYRSEFECKMCGFRLLPACTVKYADARGRGTVKGCQECMETRGVDDPVGLKSVCDVDFGYSKEPINTRVVHVIPTTNKPTSYSCCLIASWVGPRTELVTIEDYISSGRDGSRLHLVREVDDDSEKKVPIEPVWPKTKARRQHVRWLGEDEAREIREANEAWGLLEPTYFDPRLEPEPGSSSGSSSSKSPNPEELLKGHSLLQQAQTVYYAYSLYTVDADVKVSPQAFISIRSIPAKRQTSPSMIAANLLDRACGLGLVYFTWNRQVYGLYVTPNYMGNMPA